MTIEITDANFEQLVLKSNKPVLVDFWAPWCAPCRILTPVIDQLAIDFDGRAIIGKVNIDANHNIVKHFRILSIPTLLFFKGGQLVHQQAGSLPKSALENKLKELL